MVSSASSAKAACGAFADTGFVAGRKRRDFCGLFGVALTVLSALAGCAGSGDGLDANGQPIGSGSNSGGGNTGGGITADFQSIQDNVFTPICSRCHIGASAPEGLQLDAAHSYALLVGVSSNEKPGVLRVKPGDPTNSYMYQKITGASGIVGNPMPLGGPSLPQTTITAIQQWIANGAQQSSTSAAPVVHTAQSHSFGVSGTSPGNDGVIDAPTATIVVAFNHEVDASLLNYTTIALEALDESASGSANAIAFSMSPAQANPSSVVIKPTNALPPGMYRVTVRGTGGGAVADISGQPLGADFSFEFTVSPAQ